jgi:hypothetical protein
MRGATCAIFMITFYSLADYDHVHRSKVPLPSSRIGFNRNRLIEVIKKTLQLRSALEPSGGTGAV